MWDNRWVSTLSLSASQIFHCYCGSVGLKQTLFAIRFFCCWAVYSVWGHVFGTTSVPLITSRSNNGKSMELLFSSASVAQQCWSPASPSLLTWSAPIRSRYLTNINFAHCFNLITDVFGLCLWNDELFRQSPQRRCCCYLGTNQPLQRRRWTCFNSFLSAHSGVRFGRHLYLHYSRYCHNH